MATAGNHYTPPEAGGQIILSQNMALWLKVATTQCDVSELQFGVLILAAETAGSF